LPHVLQSRSKDSRQKTCPNNLCRAQQMLVMWRKKGLGLFLPSTGAHLGITSLTREARMPSQLALHQCVMSANSGHRHLYQSTAGAYKPGHHDAFRRGYEMPCRIPICVPVRTWVPGLKR
jgi:hypothetical protein